MLMLARLIIILGSVAYPPRLAIYIQLPQLVTRLAGLRGSNQQFELVREEEQLLNHRIDSLAQMWGRAVLTDARHAPDQSDRTVSSVVFQLSSQETYS